MEWLTDFFTNWELLSTVIGWIVGILGVGIVTSVWSTVKSGRAMYKTYYESKPNGWTETEKNQYIEKSAEFFQSVNTLWNLIFGNGKKK
jgi:hypothetical protein